MPLRLPRDRARRRRLTVLAAGCLIAFVSGAEVGGRAGQDPATAPPVAGPGEAPVSDLSLRQQVGQLIVLRFEGTELPTYVRQALERGEAAGVILFADNVALEAQLRALTRAIQRAAGGSALIAADQEGGGIRVVPFAAPEPAAGSLTTPAQSGRFARMGARELARLGVNVNLAPVADVAASDASVMVGRAYPGGPAEVAALVRAAVKAHADGGVAATAKHFPGLGAATLNTDDAPVTIRREPAGLRRDLQPFRAAIEAGVPLVMASHALYPLLDARRIASQSPMVLGELLRQQLGYAGVVVTDSLEAEAVLSRSSTPVAAVRSLEAGADLLLTTSSGSYAPVLERLLAAAERSPELRARVEESAGRVLGLKQQLGLESPAPPRAR